MSVNTTVNGMIGFESRTDMFKAIEMLRENGYIKEEDGTLLWDSENDGDEPIRVVEDGYLSLYGAPPRNIQVNIEEIIKKYPLSSDTWIKGYSTDGSVYAFVYDQSRKKLSFLEDSEVEEIIGVPVDSDFDLDEADEALESWLQE